MDSLSLFYCSPEPNIMEPFPEPSLQRKLAIGKMMKMLQNPWIEFQLSSQPLRIFVAFMLFAQITIIFISNNMENAQKGGMWKFLLKIRILPLWIFFHTNNDISKYEIFCCFFYRGKNFNIFLHISKNKSSVALFLL